MVRLVNGSKCLHITLKSLDRAITYLKTIRELESEGEAGKISNKKLSNALIAKNEKFSLVLALKLAYLGAISVSNRVYSSAAGMTFYPYFWRSRSNCKSMSIENLEKLSIIMKKTREERENDNDSDS